MTGHMPSRKRCLEILEEAGCSQSVVEHCLAVEALAVKIAQCCKADVTLVSVGALLHDIGRSRTHDIRHVVEGSELLKKRKMDISIVRIVERHIGAGLTKEEATSLNFPEGEYIPQTLEEKIVAHADNLGGDQDPEVRKLRLEKLQNKLRKEGLDLAAERLNQLHDELCTICGRDIITLI